MKGALHSGRDHQGDLVLDCDVVVVGSGAGGAVVATELALSGLRVVVLEEGPNVPAALHGTMRPSESLRHLWREGGFTIAVPLGNTPAINVTMGRCVGGSSVLTGGVCFRIPDPVMAGWERDLGLADFNPRAMEPYFTQVEKNVHVERVPVSMRSRSTELFALGATRTGIDIKPMSRNTHGCNGCGRCNFGCPHGAKMSVDLSYLPRGMEAGVDVWSHCLVDAVVMKGARAVGVRGRLLNRPNGSVGTRLTVHARRVVVAASAWHTPGLLKRSGVENRHVGRHLTLHPGFRMLSRFDEPVRGWRGALQSAWSDSLAADGITLTGLFIPVGMLGATMPGVGVEHTRNAAHIGNLAMFGGLLHDDAGGRVWRTPGREPVVTYRMSDRDRSRIPVLVRAMGDTFFAAGAREVFPPVLGMRGMDADTFARTDFAAIPAHRYECTSQHPLGTAQMGTAPDHSVVDVDGRVWGADELYVTDGSVMPTSLGVNPQISIMSVATRLAWRMRERPFMA